MKKICFITIDNLYKAENEWKIKNKNNFFFLIKKN